MVKLVTGTHQCCVIRAWCVRFPLFGVMCGGERLRHSLCRSTNELPDEQVLTLRRVKTCRLHKQSMIRHRK
jgi:hypothetical protein